jgi:hypothetical protein
MQQDLTKRKAIIANKKQDLNQRILFEIVFS